MREHWRMRYNMAVILLCQWRIPNYILGRICRLDSPPPPPPPPCFGTGQSCALSCATCECVAAKGKEVEVWEGAPRLWGVRMDGSISKLPLCHDRSLLTALNCFRKKKLQLFYRKMNKYAFNKTFILKLPARVG